MTDQIPQHLLDVESGWHGLLQELHQRALDIDPRYRCAQVKEKFGALRVYMDPSERDFGTDAYNGRGRALFDAADDVETRSTVICEWCGEPGRCRSLTTRWLKTLCDGCAPTGSTDATPPNSIRMGKFTASSEG